MKRTEVIDWFRNHPGEIHAPPEEIVARCEQEVHRHVLEEAWLRAREVAQAREDYWRSDGGGAHASEAFVAREVCRELATELKRIEPVPEAGHASEYVDAHSLEALEVEARTLMLRYVLDLARREEHATWLEVLHFTRKKGVALARNRTFSQQLDFEQTHAYAETATRVMHILVEDYERFARPQTG